MYNMNRAENLVVITVDQLEEFLKYKSLYENELSHSDTLQKIINKLIEQDKKQSLPINWEDWEDCDCSSCDVSDVCELSPSTDDSVSKGKAVDIGTSFDFPDHWTSEQKRDVEKAFNDIIDTITVHQLKSLDLI